LVEDIIDTGKTIRFLHKKFQNIPVKSISIATLLMKPNSQKFDFNIDYIGFEIKQGFVVGYGLDYNQRYRNLNGLYLLENEIEF
jgi:hypoxanthine phosphoribosyltransferase